MEVEHFSNSSVNCHLHAIKQLCLFTGKLPGQMVKGDIYSYLLHLKTTKHQGRETIRNHLQGIGFVFRKLYKRIDITQDIPYPKHTKKLPVILNSKGDKDRYTLLAKKTVPGLGEYYRKYKPQKYLFNGKYKSLPYTFRRKPRKLAWNRLRDNYKRIPGLFPHWQHRVL
jgi:integrase